MLRILFISLVLVMASYSGASAQMKGNLTVKDDESEKKKYEEMIISNYEYSEADFDLMGTFYRRCTNNGTAVNYDCECLAVKYLNKKIIYDDTMSDYQIHMETAGECVDVASVAGAKFEECSALGKASPLWNKAFCECFANKYADEFKEKGGVLTQGELSNARAKAMGECNFNSGTAEADRERRKRAVELTTRAQRRLQ